MAASVPAPLVGAGQGGGSRRPLIRGKWRQVFEVRRDPPPQSSPTRGEEAALRGSGTPAASRERCVHPVAAFGGRCRRRRRMWGGGQTGSSALPLTPALSPQAGRGGRGAVGAPRTHGRLPKWRPCPERRVRRAARRAMTQRAEPRPGRIPDRGKRPGCRLAGRSLGSGRLGKVEIGIKQRGGRADDNDRFASFLHTNPAGLRRRSPGQSDDLGPSGPRTLKKHASLGRDDLVTT